MRNTFVLALMNLDSRFEEQVRRFDGSDVTKLSHGCS